MRGRVTERASIRLRPATPADAEALWRWRNEPSTRAQSFDSRPILLAVHRDWLADKLADRSVLLAIVELDGLAVGQVRLEGVNGPEAEIHIGLGTQARGRGVGRAALEEAAGWAAERGVRRVVAHVKRDNAASLRAFAAAGFVPDGHAAGEAVRLVRTLTPS